MYGVKGLGTFELGNKASRTCLVGHYGAGQVSLVSLYVSKGSVPYGIMFE